MEIAEEKHDKYIFLDFLIFTFFYDWKAAFWYDVEKDKNSQLESRKT